MKNSIKILFTIIIVAPLVFSTIACGKIKLIKENIALITDAGSINDKSFNELSWNAINAFIKKYPNKHFQKKYFTPQNNNDILNKYVAAANNYYGTIVVPGFLHAKNLQEFCKTNKDIFKKQHYIWLDANKFDLANIDNQNVAKIVFDSVVSGFYAGVSSGIFLNYKMFDQNEIKVSTWGGGDKQGVVDFMAGFYAGIRYFNNDKNTLELQKLFSSIFNNDSQNLKPTFKKIKFINPFTGTRIDNHNVGEVPNIGSADDWFTNFNSQGGMHLAKKAYKLGVNAMMPVAGIQTMDWLNVIKDNNDVNRFTIGVDIDMSKVYDSKTFITSALKDLKTPIIDSLTAIKNKHKDLETYKKYFSNNVLASSLEWSGIANNQDFPKLSANIMKHFTDNSTTNTKAIDVKEWYKKVVSKNFNNIWMGKEIFKTKLPWE